MLSLTPKGSTMTTSNQVVNDTNILVALVDRLDKWHASAESLREAFRAKNAWLAGPRSEGVPDKRFPACLIP
jgi:hypothetical protein